MIAAVVRTITAIGDFASALELVALSTSLQVVTDAIPYALALVALSVAIFSVRYFQNVSFPLAPSLSLAITIHAAAVFVLAIALLN